jgi:hypothetical protein
MNQLKSIPASQIVAKLKGRSFSYVSVLSFEERCTAWPDTFGAQGCLPARLFFVNYATRVEPPDEDRQLRATYRDRIRATLKATKITSFEKVNAFAAAALVELATNILNQSNDEPIVYDISCMTRVHLVALAQAIRRHRSLPELFFAYATPRSYGFQKGLLLGWRDTLFVPINTKLSFRREGNARGLVFAGHSSERLSVALHELEPSSGVFVYAREEGRPDLLAKAKEVNKPIEDRLRRLRMPRMDKWRIETLGLNDCDGLNALVSAEILQAKNQRGPIVLFPFGPKPMTLAASLVLAFRDDLYSLAVYPVPESFDVNYSSGANQIHAFSLGKSGRSKQLDLDL